MNNEKYAVYGIVEPHTRKIVYIDFYVYDWDNIKEYPSQKEMIEDTIDIMRDNNNVYWRDLYNMYENNNYNEILIGVVVLESSDNLDYIKKRVKYWEIVFKPRYNKE